MMIDLWDRYWSDPAEHDWWLRPAPEVLDLIASLSPDSHPSVLDLGCGLGRHAVAFAAKGFEVAATDVSSRAVESLREWAGRLDLPVATCVCEMLAQPFPRGSFDVVLSYNVLYHGSREAFAAAIRHVRSLLRPTGLFFFTCPTRRDGKYGFGECVAPHTWASSKSVTPGDIHYFADEADLDEMVAGAGFAIRSMEMDEGTWNNRGEEQFFSNRRVLAEKTGGPAASSVTSD